MKGIVLAGGTGTRLTPLTKVTNKHLLPVGKYPMVIHAVNKLTEAGVNDIMVITGTEHMGDMITLLGSGHDYACDFTFRVQDLPDGIAGALLLCENFARNDSVVVILGDNIFEDDLAEILERYEAHSSGEPTCMLCLKEVEDPHRFGVPKIIDGTVVKIVEKPKDPPSNFCVTGIYVYDNNVFDFIKSLKKSARGEYEITDVNNMYISKGVASAYALKGWWTDAGTHSSYHLANKLVQE
jgi:glucose-1-phosphate thymidylyltransferase